MNMKEIQRQERAAFFAVMFVVVAVIVFMATHAFGETQVFFTNKPDSVIQWDHPGDPDLAGFKLYYKIVGSTALPSALDIPGKDIRTHTWINTPVGKYELYMTAYDLYGNESDPSAPIHHYKKIAKPGSVTKIVTANPSFTLIIP